MVSVAYSTGYTSLMTNPRYSKSVDTLQEFVDNSNLYIVNVFFFNDHNLNTLMYADFTWGYYEYTNDLEKSDVPAYQQLFKQAFKEHSPAEKLRNIQENPRYGVYTEVVFGRFLTAIQTVLDEALKMRPMKSCIDNHYTTFPMQKNSPYTEYFNEKIAM